MSDFPSIPVPPKTKGEERLERVIHRSIAKRTRENRLQQTVG